MRISVILELFIYAMCIGYFFNFNRKLNGTSAAAIEFRQRIEDRKKAGGFSLSMSDHKKLNQIGIIVGVSLCAHTIYNALK